MTAPATSAAAGLRQRAGLPVLTWPAFDPLPVEAIVTTRHGGVSAGGYATLNLSFAVGAEPATFSPKASRAAAATSSPTW
jgi:polyphenol oxidase